MIQAPSLAGLDGIRHRFFTRRGGVSSGFALIRPPQQIGQRRVIGIIIIDGIAKPMQQHQPNRQGAASSASGAGVMRYAEVAHNVRARATVPPDPTVPGTRV